MKEVFGRGEEVLGEADGRDDGEGVAGVADDEGMGWMR